MPRRWKKQPPDGTNYAYWESNDGFVIETKPRFRPQIPYTLHFPRDWPKQDGAYPCTDFQTLALAKAGAELPQDRLFEFARSDYARSHAMLATGVAS